MKRYLNSTEVAHIMGVGSPALSMWRSRGKTGNLPDPDAVVGKTPLWEFATIKSWIEAEHKETMIRLRAKEPRNG
jgi:hypothetical protein